MKTCTGVSVGFVADWYIPCWVAVFDRPRPVFVDIYLVRYDLDLFRLIVSNERRQDSSNDGGHPAEGCVSAP